MDSKSPSTSTNTLASAAGSGSPSNFIDVLATDIVVLNIGTGPSSTKVRVQRDILSEKSPVMAVVLSPPSGDKPKELDLLDEKPNMFGLLLEYIYKGKVRGTPDAAVKTETMNETETAAPSPSSTLRFVTQCNVRGAPDIAVKVETIKKPEPPAPNRTPSLSLRSVTLNGETKKVVIGVFSHFRTVDKFKRYYSSVAGQVPPEAAKLFASSVKNEIDLHIMESKLVQGAYEHLGNVDADFDMMYQNYHSHNGPQHASTKGAAELRAMFHKKTEELRQQVQAAQAAAQASSSFSSSRSLLTPFQQREARLATICILLPSSDLLELYILAIKYQVTSLLDLAMTSLIQAHIKSNTYLTLAEIAPAFFSVPENSPLRTYIIKTISYFLLAKSDRFNDQPDSLHKTVNLYKLITQNSEIGISVFTLLRAKNGIPLNDPRKAGICDYHVHGDNEHCEIAGGNVRKRKMQV